MTDMTNVKKEDKIETSKMTRKLTGVVVSDKMDKTRTIAIVEKRRHALYHKSYYVTTKIKAHDAENQFKNGDKVEIESVRPISKDKTYRIITKYIVNKENK